MGEHPFISERSLESLCVLLCIGGGREGGEGRPREGGSQTPMADYLHTERS